MNVPTYLSLENASEDRNFKNFIIVSLIAHASLLILVGLKNLFTTEQNLVLTQSIRVDVVALPEKAVDLPAPQPEPAPAPAVKKPEPVKLNAKPSQKDQQQKALEKLKAMSAIEKLRQEIEEKNRAQAREAVKPPPYKGQVISSGNSFQGMSRLRVNEYLENLTSRVRDHWELPQWLSDANLKAIVVVSIDARGVVVKNEIHTPSGNAVFDASCLAAVQASAPFTAPPDEVREALLLIRFPFE